MKDVIKKIVSAAVSLTMLSLTGCSTTSTNSTDKNNDELAKTYLGIELGKDFTDLSADINVLTPRTDIVMDTDAPYEFPDYVREFNKLYPNIHVTHESATEYDFDISNRLHSGNWGNVCSIPASIDRSDLHEYFLPYFTLEEIGDRYTCIDNESYDGLVYGIPTEINAQGIIYNKAVFKEAGIENLPKTPDEFIEDLRVIKQKTNAIPLYTNYTASWALTHWDYHAVSSAVGDPDYRNKVLVETKRPFGDPGDGTGPYAVYNILYRAVAEGLVEDNPHDSSWELCKNMINQGEIATMVLGSWAVAQMQEAGDKGEDIGYMPFPITVNGKQYTLSGSGYCYGINKNSPENEQLASKIFVKFMTEQSGYSYNNTSLPIVNGGEYPDAFEVFSENDVEMLPDYPLSDEFNNISNNSIKLTSDPQHVLDVVDYALEGKDFDELMESWNDSWEEAVNSATDAKLGDNISDDSNVAEADSDSNEAVDNDT